MPICKSHRNAIINQGLAATAQLLIFAKKHPLSTSWGWTSSTKCSRICLESSWTTNAANASRVQEIQNADFLAGFSGIYCMQCAFCLFDHLFFRFLERQESRLLRYEYHGKISFNGICVQKKIYIYISSWNSDNSPSWNNSPFGDDSPRYPSFQHVPATSRCEVAIEYQSIGHQIRYPLFVGLINEQVQYFMRVAGRVG